jgi:tetratricopeptide (TPR) repeat protein
MRAWVCLCVVLAASPLEAQEARNDEEARALFDAAEIAFQEGRYENALDYFRRSHELSDRAPLLYNIGVTAERLRRDQEALDAFRRYLAEVPDAANRQAVEARIQILERSLSEPRSEDGAAGSDRTSGSGPNVGAIAVAIAGGVVTAAGVVLLAIGLSDRASVEGATRGAMWEAVEGAYSRAGPLTISGIVGLGVGVAVLAAGIGWLAVGGGAEVALGPGGVSLRGTF